MGVRCSSKVSKLHEIDYYMKMKFHSATVQLLNANQNLYLSYIDHSLVEYPVQLCWLQVHIYRILFCVIRTMALKNEL